MFFSVHSEWNWCPSASIFGKSSSLCALGFEFGHNFQCRIAETFVIQIFIGNGMNFFFDSLCVF